MSSFEVTYQDPTIPSINCVVIVPADNRLEALNKVYECGLKPLRVKPLSPWNR